MPVGKEVIVFNVYPEKTVKSVDYEESNHKTTDKNMRELGYELVWIKTSILNKYIASPAVEHVEDVVIAKHTEKVKHIEQAKYTEQTERIIHTEQAKDTEQIKYSD